MPGVLKQYVDGAWTPIITGADGADGATGPAANTFSTVAANGTNLVASTDSTLTIEAGDNITITGNASSDTLTIASTASGGGTGNVQFSGYNITSDVEIESGTTPKPGRIVVGNVTVANNDNISSGKHGIFSFAEQVEPNVSSHGQTRYYMSTNDLYVDQTVHSDTLDNNSRFHTVENTLTLVGDFPQTSSSRNVNQRNYLNIGEGSSDGNETVGVALHAGLGMLGDNSDLTTGYALVLNSYDGASNTNIGKSAGIVFGFGHAFDSNSDHYNYWNADPDGSDPVKNNTNSFAYSNYYNIRNDDKNSQERLGALRRYHERMREATRNSGAGTMTIDADDSPVQYKSLTENITSVTLQDFITNTTSMQTAQNVSVLFINDATGRSVTFPTGSGYYYANGVNTVPATANSHTWVHISGVSDRSSGTHYYISISPAFETV